MRKLQFKAWDRINKKFITDYKLVLPAHYNGTKYPIEQGGTDHNCIYVPIFDEKMDGIADPGGYIDDCDLLLFIGHKDKTGLEMYDGDIIEWNGYRLEIRRSKNHAGFVAGNSTIEYLLTKKISSECEIIGNIQQNPKRVH